jgi:anti-anti-sigma factor
MNFSKEVQNNILIITAEIKRATMSESAEFKEYLLKYVEEGWTKILIDLSTCEFIDSTFLGTLISASRKIIKIEGSIRIVANYNLIPSILKLTGTSKMLLVFESKVEAVESFNTKN